MSSARQHRPRGAKGSPKNSAPEKEITETGSRDEGQTGETDPFGEIQNMLKNIDSKFSKRFDVMEQRFNEIIKKVRDEFVSLREELMEETKEVKSRLDGLEGSLEYHVHSIEKLEEKQSREILNLEQELTKKICALEEHLLLHEKNSRKYNLLFYGIPQSANENIYDTMKEFFRAECGLSKERVDSIRYHHAHRYGKREHNKGPEPIIVRFVSYSDREEIFQKGFNLPKGKRILSDLPVKMKQERGRLATEAYKIRNTEHLQTRIRDIGTRVVLQTRKDRQDTWSDRHV